MSSRPVFAIQISNTDCLRKQQIRVHGPFQGRLAEDCAVRNITIVNTHSETFRKDGTYTLILRLRQNVIKTGIRMMQH
jgi:hypothetical protein